jgi:nitroreductase
MTPMHVTQAVDSRRSVRAFLPDPVSDELLRQLLERASRAPSGGNVQPWRVYVLNGDSMQRFREHLTTQPPMETPEYAIYPDDLPEPYRTNRFEVGEAMYALLGLDRDDKAGRLQQLARNGDFFGAPAAFFCFVDRMMGPPQWSDLGMFLQTFMLLALEAGLGTCPQEFWAVRNGAVRSFVNPPENEMLFCGMAVGHVDDEAPVNRLRTRRMTLDQWATFL